LQNKKGGVVHSVASPHFLDLLLCFPFISPSTLIPETLARQEESEVELAMAGDKVAGEGDNRNPKTLTLATLRERERKGEQWRQRTAIARGQSAMQCCSSRTPRPETLTNPATMVSEVAGKLLSMYTGS